jgi:hypothetical protein
LLSLYWSSFKHLFWAFYLKVHLPLEGLNLFCLFTKKKCTREHSSSNTGMFDKIPNRSSRSSLTHSTLSLVHKHSKYLMYTILNLPQILNYLAALIKHFKIQQNFLHILAPSPIKGQILRVSFTEILCMYFWT